jgi:uncharacterized membrane protein YhhN
MFLMVFIVTSWTYTFKVWQKFSLQVESISALELQMLQRAEQTVLTFVLVL